MARIGKAFLRWHSYYTRMSRWSKAGVGGGADDNPAAHPHLRSIALAWTPPKCTFGIKPVNTVFGDLQVQMILETYYTACLAWRT